MRRSVALLLACLSWMGAFYEWGGQAAKGVRELKKGEPKEASQSLLDGRRELPHSAAVSYDRALALSRAGLPDSAAAGYYSTFTSPSLHGQEGRASAAFNLGNDAMRTDHVADAIHFYRESLRADPTRADAKRNLEEAIRRARREMPKQQNHSSGGGGGKVPKGGGPTSSQGQNGNPPPQAGRQPQSGQQQAPNLGGSIPNRAEAEHWLDALEAERKASRLHEHGGPERETGQRDW